MEIAGDLGAAAEPRRLLRDGQDVLQQPPP